VLSPGAVGRRMTRGRDEGKPVAPQRDAAESACANHDLAEVDGVARGLFMNWPRRQCNSLVDLLKISYVPPCSYDREQTEPP
jgi:hypothetical protein